VNSNETREPAAWLTVRLTRSPDGVTTQKVVRVENNTERAVVGATQTWSNQGAGVPAGEKLLEVRCGCRSRTLLAVVWGLPSGRFVEASQPRPGAVSRRQGRAVWALHEFSDGIQLYCSDCQARSVWDRRAAISAIANRKNGITLQAVRRR
jgi:hypothetical protein